MIDLKKNIDFINELCEEHNVEKLYLFGSVLTDSFTDQSDVDIMVTFKPFDLSLYLINYLDLKDKLKLLFGREVDLLESQTLRNPVLIRNIEKSKKLVYG